MNVIPTIISILIQTIENEEGDDADEGNDSDDDDKDEARNLLARGVFRFNRNDRWVLKSTDPVDKILRQTLDMCFIYDPGERASSRDVANYLNAHWKELNGKGVNQKNQREPIVY